LRDAKFKNSKTIFLGLSHQLLRKSVSDVGRSVLLKYINPFLFAIDVPSYSPTIYSLADHGIDRYLIDPDAVYVVRRLHRAGFSAYIVGGGVRDILLRKKPKDFDIATNATPRQIKQTFSNSRIIGKRFKLAHVFFSGGKIFEVATFRDSSKEEGGQPQSLSSVDDNIYGSEATDALRRDLTINGLYYDPESQTIVDYVGGMNDIRDRVVRIIGDPTTRFIEDPVRILRVIRHAVRSGFKVDSSTEIALRESVRLLETASPIRVFDEMRKDMDSGAFTGVLCSLAHHSVLSVLIPLLIEQCSDTESPFLHMLKDLDERIQNDDSVSYWQFLATMFLGHHPHVVTFQAPLPYQSIQEMREALKGFFSHLAVPRRERESIERVVGVWMSIHPQLFGSCPELHDDELVLGRTAFREFEEVLKMVPPSPHFKTAYLAFKRLSQTSSSSLSNSPRSPLSDDSAPLAKRRRRKKVPTTTERSA
jgi:poly(A) polymerase